MLGIVGGAGPLVAARLQWEFLSAYQRATGARKDSDYPPVICVNAALAEVDETGVKDAHQAGKSLQGVLETMANAGATHALVACASLHACLPSAPPLPVLDWLRWPAIKLAGAGSSSIGVVGSSSARKDGVFRQALTAQGVEAIELPEEGQSLADRLIAQGMTGVFGSEEKALMEDIRSILESQGATCIWWGCTELSLMPRSWMKDQDLYSMQAMVSTMLQATLPSISSLGTKNFL